MPSVRVLILPAAIAAVMLPLVQTANASSPERMMQVCRIRAHEVIHTRLPDVETKYEGQRTDGTHAVNGTAWVSGRTETFQCSFDRHGGNIIQFVVNQPAGGSTATPLPESEPQTRTVNVDFRGNAVQEFRESLYPGESVRYVFRGGNRKFLQVHLYTRNNRTYFNIFTPDRHTLYESARAGNDYRGQLWLDGEHVVEVYNTSQARASFDVTLQLQ
ncbi:MAG: hypothetical protein AB7E81_24240 [Hyphomicrobiaceae bacterium]